MSASIDATGLAGFSKVLGRIRTGGLQKQLVANLQQSGPRIELQVHAAARTGIQRTGAQSVSVTRSTNGIDIRGGGGGGLSAVLFDGAEYGGRKPRKVVYATRSPRGAPYVVRRRTTMQFLPHLGRRGYMFWPTIRKALPALVERQEALVTKTLEG